MTVIYNRILTVSKVNGQQNAIKLRINARKTSGDDAVLIHIRSVFDITIRLNTNTLFGLLFGLNRIQIEYLVQLQLLYYYC